jgi:hypothetical protein
MTRMRPIISLSIVLFAASFAVAQPSDSTSLDPAVRNRLEKKQLLFCFQGKGSCLPYDIGVMRAMYDQIPAIRENKIIVTGNSSGSILATYFSNFGFSDANMQYAENRLKVGGIEAIRKMEQSTTKAIKLARGEATELPHLELKEFVAFALGVEDWESATTMDEIVARSTARPRFPVVIVACNREVLDNRETDSLLGSKKYKIFDPSNFSVSWKPEIHAYFQSHPDQFAQEFPDLKLGPTPYIGKACTFFVDRSMFELLKQVPAAERIADLRIMETPADMALAIQASASEPTYFKPMPENDLSKILSDNKLGDLSNVNRRSYCGGFLVSQPAQDVKRMLPALHVAGSGWMHNPTTARKLLSAWYLADAEDVAHLTDWWADIQFNPVNEMRAAMVSKTSKPNDEYEAGKKTAETALARNRALPMFVNQPTFHFPSEFAVVPSGDSAAFLDTPDELGKQQIKVGRGLGALKTRE